MQRTDGYLLRMEEMGMRLTPRDYYRHPPKHNEYMEIVAQARRSKRAAQPRVLVDDSFQVPTDYVPEDFKGRRAPRVKPAPEESAASKRRKRAAAAAGGGPGSSGSGGASDGQLPGQAVEAEALSVQRPPPEAQPQALPPPQQQVDDAAAGEAGMRAQLDSEQAGHEAGALHTAQKSQGPASAIALAAAAQDQLTVLGSAADQPQHPGQTAALESGAARGRLGRAGKGYLTHESMQAQPPALALSLIPFGSDRALDAATFLERVCELKDRIPEIAQYVESSASVIRCLDADLQQAYRWGLHLFCCAALYPKHT
jgi:hypothetical protein